MTKIHVSLVKHIFAPLVFLFASAGVIAQTVDVASVTASGHDGNLPTNTLDGDLGTRWSAKGDGQWIRYDLGAVSRIQAISIAFFRGDQRTADIIVETSLAGETWQHAWSGTQPQLTNNPQNLDFEDVEARYLRVVGFGNSSNNWNSLTEVSISAMSVTQPEITPPPGENWDYCAREGQQCDISGEHEIAYGRDDAWNYGFYINNVSCSNAVFGDPIAGRTKYCWIRPVVSAPPGITPPPGLGWVYCEKEQAQCEFNGTREVGYGRDNAWNFTPFSNGVTCNNAMFGDPIPGRSKHCWTRVISVTIDLAAPRQLIDLMGGDMERSAGFLDNATNAQQIADWHYKDIKFAHSRVSFDRKQELAEGQPNLAFYNAAISAMKKVKVARPDVKFWATMKSDYDGYGTTNNLPDWIYTGGGYNGGSYDPTKLNTAKYARFLADYLKYMHENDVSIAYLSVSKEWAQVFDVTRERETINALKQLLNTATYANVPEPKFFGPSTWGATQATNFVNTAINAGSMYLYDGVGTHSYDNPSQATWTNLVNIVNAQGKSIWHTESSYGGGGRYSGAEPPITTPINAYLGRAAWYRAGLQGELFFENWSRGVAAETRGVYFTNNTPGVRLRSYYIMKRFANNAAGARYLNTINSGLTGADTMAFIDDKTVIVWVINNTTHRVDNINFIVNGGTLVSSAIDRLAWYNGSATSGYAATLNRNNNTTFSNGVGPMSIVSYVFEVN